MKRNLKFYIASLLIMCAVFVGFAETSFFVAIQDTQEVPPMGWEQILVYIAPFAVWAGSFLAIKLLGITPRWLKQIVVVLLSTGLAYVTAEASNVELTDAMRFVWGLSAIILDNVLKNFDPNKKLKSFSFYKKNV